MSGRHRACHAESGPRTRPRRRPNRPPPGTTAASIEWTRQQPTPARPDPARQRSGAPRCGHGRCSYLIWDAETGPDRGTGDTGPETHRVRVRSPADRQSSGSSTARSWAAHQPAQRANQTNRPPRPPPWQPRRTSDPIVAATTRQPKPPCPAQATHPATGSTINRR